jgi:biotin carboxylase
MTFRILVTAAGGALAPLNIRLLKETTRYDVWVAAVDTRSDAAGRHFADFFSTVPAGTDPHYAESIVQLVEKLAIDLVFPWSDEEALALSLRREAIAALGATLACVPRETLLLMNDKAATFRHLQAHGLPVPRWSLVHSADELARATAAFLADTGAFVIKPVAARGNRGVIVVGEPLPAVTTSGSREIHTSRDGYQQVYAKDAANSLPLIVMERLFPPAYDIDVLANGGELVLAVARKRINPLGVPFRGNVIVPDDPLLETGRRLAKAFAVSWLCDFDLMTDRSGTAYVIEANSRPSGSIAAAILAGASFYDDLISLALGTTPLAKGIERLCTVVPYLDCRVARQPTA